MEEGNNFINWLPPELLNMIFNKLDKTQVVQLRLVSNYWKNVVDDHQYFTVKMDGSVPATIPGPSLKFKSLDMTNFLQPCIVQLPELTNQVNRLQYLKLAGPSHPLVVQQILQGAVNLKKLEIEELAFRYRGPHFSSSTLSLTNTKKMQEIKISKLSAFYPQISNRYQIHGEKMILHKYVKVVSVIFNQSVVLPILSSLILEYSGLPIQSMQDLVVSTVIPFVQRHASSLKTLHVIWMAKSAYEFNPTPFPDIQQTHHYGSPALESLALRVPDAILNGLLIGIYNNIVPTTTMEHVILKWDKPYQSTPSQEEIAYKIIQQLVRANQSKVIALHLENFNSNSVILGNNTSGSCKFDNMLELTVGGRNVNGSVPQNQLPLYQVKIVVQLFSKITYILLHNLCLKLKPFSENVLQNCTRLETLILRGNKYYDDIKVDVDLMTALARKQGMRIITIGVDDFCNPLESNYWSEFKRVFGYHAWEYDGDNHSMVLRL